jgi:hypothetical protein
MAAFLSSRLSSPISPIDFSFSMAVRAVAGAGAIQNGSGLSKLTVSRASV